MVQLKLHISVKVMYIQFPLLWGNLLEQSSYCICIILEEPLHGNE